ncbi:hypothetical protein [Salibacterium sp. K-3]
MKNITTVVIITCSILITACGSSDIQEKGAGQAAETYDHPMEEKQPLSGVKSVTDQKKESVYQFNSLFEDEAVTTLFSLLEEKRETIENEAGTPLEEGSFEGAPFIRYENGTFFFSPDTEKAQTFAVQHPPLEAEDIEAQLGSPDETLVNEMEGLWTEKYQYEDGTIIVEKAEETSEKITCIWLEINEE